MVIKRNDKYIIDVDSNGNLAVRISDCNQNVKVFPLTYDVIFVQILEVAGNELAIITHKSGDQEFICVDGMLFPPSDEIDTFLVYLNIELWMLKDPLGNLIEEEEE